MPDPTRDRGYLYRMYVRHRESDTMLGIAMAAIAVLFIVGIITAFIHAADNNVVLHATNGPANPPAETTGSGR